ncbi:MAG: acylphosphatase [Planctomycetota bacterium]
MNSPDPRHRRRATIFSGRVQGVGFRVRAWSVAQQAEHAHAITGWVRNEPDGTVRLEAQGTPDAVARYLADVRAEMGSLIVGEADVPAAELEGETGFEIRY